MAYLLELNVPDAHVSEWEASVSKGNPDWKLGKSLQLLAAMDTDQGLRVLYVFDSKEDADRFLQGAAVGGVASDLQVTADSFHGRKIARLVTQTAR